MPKVNNNLLTMGLSGLLGKTLVFRKHGNETIVTMMPRESSKPPTAAQLLRRQRFKAAVAYAKAQLADAASKAIYQVKANTVRTAYHVALADFMNPPRVHNIEVAATKGKKDNLIRVLAIDDFEVISVDVYILDKAEKVLETGAAVMDAGGLYWSYILQSDLPETAAIKAVAKDRAGNEGMALHELPH